MTKFFQSIALVFLVGVATAQPNYHLFVGTYTGKSGSQGIYLYRFDAAAGRFDSLGVAPATNPSYLALNAEGNRLYAVGESGGERKGNVSAFDFDPSSSQLSYLNTVATGGDNPCYVTTERSGRWLAVANYTGGSLSVLKLLADGRIDTANRTVVQHEGSSVNKGRQEKPHVHAAVFDPEQKNLITTDLGTDLITITPVQPKKVTLLQPGGYTIKLEGGAGPRHIELHPKLPVLYAVEELTGKVSVYELGADSGRMLQRVTSDTVTLAGVDKGSADIHLSPDARFLYVSNRAAANNLAIFRVDAVTGLLQTVGYQPTLGKKPRNFVIDPTGNYVLVANQDSNSIVVFTRSATTGLLSPTGTQLTVPAPVCLKLLAIKR
jgi:6-phosphogluconolactonase